MKSIKEEKMRKFFKYCSYLITLLFLFSSDGNSSEIYYVYGEPNSEIDRNIPFPAEIISYDIATRKLTTIWETKPLDFPISSIKIIGSLNRLFISTHSEGAKLTFPLKLNHLDELQESFRDTNNSFHHYVYKNVQNDIVLQFIYSDNSVNKTKSSFLSLRTKNSSAESLQEGSTIFISGITSPYCSPQHDIISIDINDVGEITPRISDIKLSLPRINQFKKAVELRSGWVLISNGSKYSAIYSLSNSHDDLSGLLFVYNKTELKWDSLSIRGSETGLRIINEYLCGNIAYKQFSTDNYGTMQRIAPKITEDVIIVAPLSKQITVVHLGNGCEVLWIDENNEIYYRIEDSLYTAKLENNVLINKKLLVTDPKIKHIHWAFRGSLGN